MARGNAFAVQRISEVLHDLVLWEVESMLELETSAGVENSVDDLQANAPDLDLLVGTLKKMVGTLVADMKATPALRELVNAIQKSSAAFKDPVISEQPSSRATSGEPEESRRVETGALHSPQICRHTCTYHPEVMDPWIWSRLPEHLMEQVFARLLMHQIFAVGWLSKAWLAALHSSGFKRICAEVHSKTFGIVGYNEGLGKFRIGAFDFRSFEWVYRDLKELPTEDMEDAMFAHDGGLVCCVGGFDEAKGLHTPILVCNPLTNEWRTLPQTKLSRELPVLLQLVRDVEAGHYRVIMVCRKILGNRGSQSHTGALIAESFDSQTGLWSAMTSGLVVRADHTHYNLPKVFDCASKMLLNLDNRACLQDVLVADSAIVRGHLFALHESADPQTLTYEVSELAGQQRSPSIMKRLNLYKTTLMDGSNTYVVQLFASDGFILLVADNGDENYGEYHHQLLRLYDIARDQWHKLPILNEIYTVEKVEKHFMCELRWDAFP